MQRCLLADDAGIVLGESLAGFELLLLFSSIAQTPRAVVRRSGGRSRRILYLVLRLYRRRGLQRGCRNGGGGAPPRRRRRLRGGGGAPLGAVGPKKLAGNPPGV